MVRILSVRSGDAFCHSLQLVWSRYFVLAPALRQLSWNIKVRVSRSRNGYGTRDFSLGHLRSVNSGGNGWAFKNFNPGRELAITGNDC